MPRLETFPLSAWIRYYSNFGTRSLERMQEAIEALESEKYSPEKFMSDVALNWADLANGWWTAMRQAASGPVPTVFMRILSNDQVAAEGDVAVECIGEGRIETTDPVLLGAPATTAKAAPGSPARQALGGKHVAVEPHPGKQGCLRVLVRRILVPDVPPGTSNAERSKLAAERAATPHFTAGTYHSLVHQNGKLLAVLIMLVIDARAGEDDLTRSG